MRNINNIYLPSTPFDGKFQQEEYELIPELEAIFKNYEGMSHYEYEADGSGAKIATGSSFVRNFSGPAAKCTAALTKAGKDRMQVQGYSQEYMCGCNHDCNLLPEFEVYPNLEYDSPDLKWGTTKSKEFIRWLQKSLNRILRLRVPLVVNGVMTPHTKEAIKMFQRKVPLTLTGSADNETIAAIEKASRTTAPVHIATVPSGCINGVDITKDFRQFIADAKAMVAKIAKPPLTKRITDEIDSIVNAEAAVDFPKYKILLCSKIINPLVIGQKVRAEVIVSLKEVHLSHELWDLHNEFLRKRDMNVLIDFFQVIAHEKRHATIANIVSVIPSSVKKGLDQQLADQATYHVQEILVKAEEIAVGKTMNPRYIVPIPEQQNFERNWNILVRIVTNAERIRLRKLIKTELQKRYLSDKGCDSPITLGVLHSMDNGTWFLCDRGTGKVVGAIPDTLTICKNTDGTHKLCGVH